MRRPIAGLSLVIFLVYTGQFMAYPFISLYIVEKGGGPLDVGLIVSLNLILAALLSIPMGGLSDHLGRRKVLLLGVVVSAIAHFFLPLTSTPTAILLAYLVAGLGHAAYGPVTAAMVGDLAERRQIATAFGVTQAARRTGNLVGPALGGFLAAFIGISPIFFICGLFQALGAAVAALALPSLRILGEGSWPKNSGGNIIGERSSSFKDPVIFAAVTGTLASNLVFLGYGSYIPLFTKNLGATTSYIGSLFGLQALLSILARVPIAKYSDKTGKRVQLVVLGLLLSALAIALTAIIPNLFILMTLAALIGLGDALGGAIANVIIAERSRVARGAVFGINNTAIYAGQALGSIITGAIIARHGFEVGFLSLSLLLVASALVFSLVAKRANIS